MYGFDAENAASKTSLATALAEASRKPESPHSISRNAAAPVSIMAGVTSVVPACRESSTMSSCVVKGIIAVLPWLGDSAAGAKTAIGKAAKAQGHEVQWVAIEPGTRSNA